MNIFTLSKQLDIVDIMFTDLISVFRSMVSGRGSVPVAVETTKTRTKTTQSIRLTWNGPDRCSSSSEDPGEPPYTLVGILRRNIPNVV